MWEMKGKVVLRMTARYPARTSGSGMVSFIERGRLKEEQILKKRVADGLDVSSSREEKKKSASPSCGDTLVERVSCDPRSGNAQ